MIKFFRKTRQQLLKMNRIGTYLKYAIGEIILVVMGILIAVSINNWNEARKQEAVLLNIFQVVQNDLERDTVQLNQLISYYEEREPYYLKIMGDSMSREEHQNCDVCPYLIVGYKTIPISTRGYELLQRYQGFAASGQDTLVVKIDQTYGLTIQGFDRVEKVIEDEIRGNLEEWEQEYPWFADLMQNKVTPEYLDYVSQG